MTTDATDTTKNLETVNAGAPEGAVNTAVDKGKGKGKSTEPADVDVAMDDDEDDEDDEDDDDEEGEDDDDDMEDEEELQEIDPTAIRSRRTRGVRVDYTSAEALEKAGLKAEDLEKEDD